MTDAADQLGHFLVDRHLQPMTQIVVELGDELANVVPDLPGANSAYAILRHCCGVVEWWTRSAILGVDVDRDRDAEFVASGPVAELARMVDDLTEGLHRDLRRIDMDASLRGDPGDHARDPVGADARGALLHVLEELAQHHGHLEITRDVVHARPQPVAGQPGGRRPRG